MPDTKITRLGITAKPRSPFAPTAIGRIMKWGQNNDVELLMEPATAELVKEKGTDRKTFLNSIDALIVLGGDGTFLAAARMATEQSIPLLGVNLGSLGFITEVALGEIETALSKMIAGNYIMEKRMMLDFTRESDKTKRVEVALNDVVFSGKSLTKMIRLSITVNGQYVTRYRADGLIISTPTGSTAYALGAGGPILYPVLDSLLICPICPHTLTNRPIVIPGDSVIEVHIMERYDEVTATIDGHVCMGMTEHDRLTVRRSEKITRIIKVPDRTHYDTLRNKLGWGGTPADNV